MLAAADTFRAAAVEQLSILGGALRIRVVAAGAGARTPARWCTTP